MGLAFDPGDALRYQYKLEGVDPDWSSPTEERTVNYSRLSSGSYRFLVRAVTSNGAISASPAVVEFRVLPPIWLTWWFISVVVIVVGMSVYALYRYRVSRLLELERVRIRIATDLHDDIGSSLSQVSALSEVVNRRVGHDPSVREPLSTIADLSRDLVDSMNDIVWAINPRRDRLSDLIHRMRRFASDVFTARDIEFRFSAPAAHHDMKLGPDLRRETYLIFKESINNMIRHSGCTEASIEFTIESGWLKLTVEDNGKGIDPNRPNRDSEGNGLTSMSQRAKRAGGSLNVVSNINQGTTITLAVPLVHRVRRSA
jgi:signal transduction histidine kinase